MSSSGVSYSSSYKSAETSQCGRGISNHLKTVTRRQGNKEIEQFDQEIERRNNEAFDDSSTRVFLFKEVSSMDEDDSCNLGRRTSWGSKLGLVKKIKLSEDGTALISESFENFCEIHKNVRRNDERPYSSDAHKIAKPHLQPTAERGLKKQQRPTTTSKLSDIAVNKYPDSIFKVYIPEGNRVIKKKRVVPLADLKPLTPVRTVPPSKGVSEPTHARNDKNLNSCTVGLPLKTKHSIPHKALQNADNRLHKAAGENSEPQVCKSVVSSQAPKKMTHITDISLTKEQETKRMKEREVMRKRTMDVVKMAFPVTGNDETKTNESGCRIYDSEISGDENSRQKGRPSKSKSSLKSFSSLTSYGQPVTGKRSVTWGENEWSDSANQRHGDNGQWPRRKKKIVHRNLSSSHNGRTDLKSSSRSKLVSGSRSHGRALKGTMAHVNRREKKKNSRPRTLNESQKPPDKFESKHINKNDSFITATTTVDDSFSDSDRKDESDSEDRCSRERFPTKKHAKDKKSFRRCDCGRVIEKNKFESENEMESRIARNTKKNDKTKKIKDGQAGYQKYSRIDGEDTFQIKRTDIIRKHSTKDSLAYSRISDFESNSNTQQESDPDLKPSYLNEEEIFHAKRGRSTPSLRKISTMDCSNGSSDSEICFRKDNNKHHGDNGVMKISCEEKPLRKIFDTSNIQMEVAKNELGITMQSAEKISCSKSFSGSIIDIDETFTEGFKTSQLNMKSVDIEQLRSNQDAQLKYLAEEDSIKENLLKEDCILNFKPVVELNSEQTKDNVQNLNVTSSHCNSLMFPKHLSNDYVLVDAYNMVTNSSKSLSREQFSSGPLIRESPMLNLPSDDKSVKRDVQGSDRKLQLRKKALKSVTEISNESNTNAQSHPSPGNSNVEDKTTDQIHSQQEHLENDYSQSFKVKSNIQDARRTRKPALRTQRPMTILASDPKNSDSIGTLRRKINSSEKRKSRQRQQPKQSSSKNPLVKNNGSSEKNHCPQSQKTAEDRKLHLQKMLSRGESVGASRMANQIMEKWHSTQKSISQRKEKMLEKIRDTRNGETERLQSPESKDIAKLASTNDASRTTQLSTHQVDHQIIQDTEVRLFIEENTVNSNEADVLLSYETQPIEQCESVNEEEDENSISEKEDFENTIIMPGSRIPQPYSSTNILDPSDKHLDESLSPYINEDTPEKPLCESAYSDVIALPFDNNLSLDITTEHIRTQITISDLDEEIPEKDLSVSSPIDSLKTDKTSPEVYINVRSSNSDVDSTYGSTRSNASNNESSFCSHIHSLSVEAVHSDENEETIQTTIQTTIPPMRNVQEVVLTKKRTVLPKSASYSRSTSHERSISRRSKASSSGSSRRSGRPPSRKPHMINILEEDSDQEIITNSSPFHVECYNRNAREPLKKAPTSRMYSTLNHTPHSGQESIKTAIRDLDGVKDDAQSNRLGSDRPMSGGHCSSSRGGGYQTCSSRPASCKSNMPKMSPGSVKILRDKSRNVPQNSATPINSNVRENVLESRNAKLSSWTQSTRRQESQKGPWSEVQDQRSSRTIHTGSPSRNTGNEKPPFRCFARKNTDEDMRTLEKLKNITINKTIENYLPPWERVDLTPPESALRERASNERRLGITSRVTARTVSPQNMKPHTRYERNSSTVTPRDSTSPVSTTNTGGRSPVGGRTPLGGRIQASSKTLADCRTSSGGKTPVVVCRTPIGGKTPVDCRTPINCRTPIGNMSPVVGRRTPTRNRTPNPSERNSVEERMVAEKNLFPWADEKFPQQTRGLARKYN